MARGAGASQQLSTEAEEAITEAARVLAAGRDLRDSMSPRRAAEEAHYAGGPSVDEIEQQIIADRRRRGWKEPRR